MTRKRQICGVYTEAIPTDALHWAARYFFYKTQPEQDAICLRRTRLSYFSV